MTVALVRRPGPALARGIVTHQERVPVDVAVRVRPTPLGPDDLVDLKPGDLLRLGHPAEAPLEVVVDGTTFAHASAGARGPRLAALIVDTPKENA